MALKIQLPTDDSGYRLTPADLNFLEIPEDAAVNCVNRTAPLGMTEKQYGFFVAELAEALWREAFHDVDVRLQGSSARLYSGPHKEMPYSRDDINETFLVEYRRDPSQYELEEVQSVVQRVWPTEDRPKRRPFDALFRIGLSPDKSDYDVQISTDIAFDIIKKKAQYRSLLPEQLVVENPDYQFMRKAYSDKSFLYLQEWAANWWKRLGRPVNIAIFVRSGPKKDTTKGEDLSSHFKESDWVIAVDTSAITQPLEQSGVTGA